MVVITIASQQWFQSPGGQRLHCVECACSLHVCLGSVWVLFASFNYQMLVLCSVFCLVCSNQTGPVSIFSSPP